MNTHNPPQSPQLSNPERYRIPEPMRYRQGVLKFAEELINAAFATYPPTAAASQETTSSPNTPSIKVATSPYSTIQTESRTASNTPIDVDGAMLTAQAEAQSSNATLARLEDTINAR